LSNHNINKRALRALGRSPDNSAIKLTSPRGGGGMFGAGDLDLNKLRRGQLDDITYQI